MYGFCAMIAKEKINCNKILFGKNQRKKALGRSRLRQEDNRPY